MYTAPTRAPERFRADTPGYYLKELQRFPPAPGLGGTEAGVDKEITEEARKELAGEGVLLP